MMLVPAALYDGLANTVLPTEDLLLLASSPAVGSRLSVALLFLDSWMTEQRTRHNRFLARVDKWLILGFQTKWQSPRLRPDI